MKSITKAIVTILVLAQYAPAAHADAAATASIEVAGENGSPRHFDAAALARLPQHTVRAQAHGQTVTCTGANVIDLLATVGAPHGAAVRGKALALYARVRAADGYRAVFALADLDPDMRGAVPIVTASCDGKPLDAKIGPFRLVVPDDKRPARWVRQVTAIDLLRAP